MQKYYRIWEYTASQFGNLITSSREFMMKNQNIINVDMYITIDQTFMIVKRQNICKIMMQGIWGRKSPAQGQIRKRYETAVFQQDRTWRESVLSRVRLTHLPNLKSIQSAVCMSRLKICVTLSSYDIYIYIYKFLSSLAVKASLQNKCRTVDPDRLNLGRPGKLSFFVIYKFWQNCASVRQVSDLILKAARQYFFMKQHVHFNIKIWDNLTYDHDLLISAKRFFLKQ